MLRARVQLVLIVLMVMVPHWSSAILSSSSQGPRTLCETDYCDCSDSLSTISCSCSATSPSNGEVVIRADGGAKLPPSLSVLQISHCPRVIFTTRALAMLRSLRRVEVWQVEQLEVHEAGLVWEPHRHLNHTLTAVGPEGTQLGPDVGVFEEVYGGPGTLPAIVISISHVRYVELPRHAFGGHIEEVVFSHVDINTINSYAFTNLRGQVDKIEFNHCSIKFIDALAFRKIYMETFVMAHSSVGKVQSRAMYDVRVKKHFRLFNLTVDDMSSSAIVVSGPIKTIISSCTFNHVSGESFRVFTRGTVTISDNVFDILDSGSFAGLEPLEGKKLFEDSFFYNPEEHESPHVLPGLQEGIKPETPQKKPSAVNIKRDLVLQNNTLLAFSNGALRLHARYSATFHRLVLAERTCDCNEISQLASRLLGLEPSSGSQYVSPPAHDTSALYRTTWCLSGSQYVTLPSFEEQRCSALNGGHTVGIALGVAGLLLLLLLLVAGLVAVLWHRRRAREIRKHTGGGIVMPEVRTYRETELQVIVEHARPLSPQPEMRRLTEDGTTT